MSGPAPADRRRAIRVALGLGVVMLASGGQAHEVEFRLREVLRALGLPGGEAVVSYSTVTVSFISAGDAEPMTAVRVVRRWRPDYDRLAAAAALVRAIRHRRADLAAAEAEIGRIITRGHPYQRWLGFAAPALLSMAVTIMFGGGLGDAATTLGIGLVIQPALERVERSELTAFFQVVFGVAATTLLVVLLVKVGLPIHGGLVLTGSLLRFLPGADLVSGMHDLISGSFMSGVARLVQVVLLGAATAAAASLVLTFGSSIDVHLTITSTGGVAWPPLVLVAAGAIAVAFYGIRVGVPSRPLLSAAALGAVAVLLARDLTPVSTGLSHPARTLLAALVIGVVGRLLAQRSDAPLALWTVPAILPLLPAPATLLPLLAESEPTRQALQGQAVQTAFGIGVGVASGSIVVEAYRRYRARLLHPVADALAARPIRGRVRPWRRASTDHGGDTKRSSPGSPTAAPEGWQEGSDHG